MDNSAGSGGDAASGGTPGDGGSADGDWGDGGLVGHGDDCAEGLEICLEYRGKMQDCYEKASVCGGTDFGNCIKGLIARDEYQPAVDACLAGPCEEVNACIGAIIHP